MCVQLLFTIREKFCPPTTIPYFNSSKKWRNSTTDICMDGTHSVKVSLLFKSLVKLKLELNYDAVTEYKVLKKVVGIIWMVKALYNNISYKLNERSRVNS